MIEAIFIAFKKHFDENTPFFPKIGAILQKI
jgi:hypothetical protein